MKGFLLLLVFILFGILFALWSPWLDLNINISKIFGVEEPEEISSLQVYSLSGELEVYVDGELIEETAKFNNDALIIDKVEPGEKLITLKKKTTVPGSYWVLNKLITFEKGKSVILSYDIGPEEEFSAGHTIYATKAEKSQSNRVDLNFKINVTDTQLYIDNIPFQINGTTLVESISLETTHKIKIIKEGYEELEFTIFPEDKDERESLVGYDINIDAQLMYQPVLVE